MTDRALPPAVRTIACAALCVVGACWSDGSRDRAVVMLEDSAGVRIASFTSLQDVDAAVWEARRTVVLDDEALFNVTDALFLKDGRLLVSNWGHSELLLFSVQGKLLRRVGRRGEGPGEYKGPYRIGMACDGSIWVYDHPLFRLTRLDSDLEVAGTWSVTGTFLAILVPLTLLPDGRIVAIHGGIRNFLSSGELRDTIPLMVIDVEARRRDTLGTWLGRERSFATVPGGAMIVPIGFARSLQAAGRCGVVAIGSTDRIDIAVFGPGSGERMPIEPKLRIRGTAANRPVSDEAERSFRDILEDVDFRSNAVPGRLDANRGATVRETMPAFGAVAVDAKGRIWVGSSPPPAATERLWVVFGQDGVPQGKLTLPFTYSAGTDGDGASEVLAIGRGRAVVHRRGAYDVEVLEIWTFDESETP